MLSKYGVDVVVKFFLVAAVIIVSAFAFTETGAVRYAATGIMGVAALFVLNFFRDPERTTPTEKNIVVSPADGKVILIGEVFEPDYLQQHAMQVSIFMSPVDVHVNRFPISGTVGYFRYVHGNYIVAFDEKSSDQNERTIIGIENKGYRVLFRQIAGFIARRIVAQVTVGQQATIGERFGMIKFGSRVDVILPKSSELRISLNDRVVAGESVLAKYSPDENPVV